MSESLDIYIGAEDTLTDVRKRLEQIPDTIRTITLVFDRQTLLRNPMDWKNLRAYARNQGKDVLIISPDSHTRAMAEVANFRVAASMEASTATKSSTRPHPVRRTGSGKSRVLSTPPPRAPQSRSSKLSGNATAWQVEQTVQSPPKSRMPQTPRPAQHSPEPLSLRDKNEAEVGEITIADLQPISELSPASSISPTFNEYDHISEIEQSEQYDSYDYPIDSTPFLPLSPQQIEEEPDMLLEDVARAQDIRRAAGGERVPATPDMGSPERGPEGEIGYKISPLPRVSNEVFEEVEEPEEARRPRIVEQRGAAFLENVDTSEHPLQKISSLDDIREGEEIEYSGGINAAHESISSSRSWKDILREDASYEDLPRVHGMRPRSSRSGKLPASEPPIEDRPTQIIAPPPPSQVSPPPGPAATPPPKRSTPLPPVAGRTGTNGPVAANRTPRPAPSAPSPQPVLSRPASRAGQPPTARNTRASATAGAARPASASRGSARTARMPVSRQEMRSNAIMVGAVIIFLLLLGCVALFIPAATVTITLASHDFSTSAKLTANTSKTQVDGSGVIPAVLLSQTFPTTGGPLTGNGTATGSTHVGTAKATGNVLFTNTGPQSLDIPQNTVIATNSGVQFVTTADAVADIQGSRVGNTVQVPVIAQMPGEIGNVPANSITIIPTSSLSQIAGANSVSPSAITLSVSNTIATTGGGAGLATIVTQADLNKEQAALALQLQGAADTWIKEHVQNGDVAGTPQFAVTVVKAPAAGQVEDSGSFAMEVTLRASVLMVRNAVIQAAAQAAMNEALQQSKSYKNYNVVTSARYPVQISQMQVKSTALSELALSFVAAGKIVPSLSESQIQSAIVGKQKRDVLSILHQLSPDIQTANVETTPGFISWVPFWAARITVNYAPGVTPTTPGVQPTPKPTAGAKK